MFGSGLHEGESLQAIHPFMSAWEGGWVGYKEMKVLQILIDLVI